MNEELLQQAIYQLKMLKDATIETVSIVNTDYVGGTASFSVDVTYEDDFRVTKAKSGDKVANVD